MFGKLTVVTALFVSGLASANFADNAGTFVGGGVWKMKDGVNGKYTGTLSISKVETGYDVKETVKISMPDGKTEEHSSSWTAVITPKSGFFDVVADGKNIGQGFCFGHACTLTVTDDGAVMGESLVFGKKGKRIMRMGYNDVKEGRVAWSGELKQQ